MAEPPTFAPALPLIQRGFRRIWEGVETGASSATAAAALKALHDGLWSGDDRKGYRQLANALRGLDWEWRWLHECASDFVGAGVWPLHWQHENINSPLSWSAIPELTKIKLLFGTMASAVYEERFVAKYLEISELEPTWRPKLISNDDRCAAERLILQRHGAAIAAGDLTRIPPFFPGGGGHFRIDFND